MRARCMSIMARSLQERRRALGAKIATPVVGVLRRLPVSPNALTVAGVVVTLIAAWLAAEGRFISSGLVLGAAGVFDLLDGALARATGRTSRFGAILDSTGDRVSEAALLAGISLWFAARGDIVALIICDVALVASLLVSYIRARGEGMGIECTAGLFTRPERVIVLALGLLSGLVFAAVCIVAFFASVTVVQRLIYLYRKGVD